MRLRLWLRTGLAAPLVAGGLLVQVAAGQDGLPVKNPLDSGPAAARPAGSFLDGIAKDLDFTLLASPGQATLRVPLAPGDWRFLGGLKPYAAVSPSTVKPTIGVGPEMAAPFRETAEDPLKGLGLGTGLQWHLSDRLDLFGQYQFKSLPGGNAPTGSPLMRREIENPGVKAGLSIHF